MSVGEGGSRKVGGRVDRCGCGVSGCVQRSRSAVDGRYGVGAGNDERSGPFLDQMRGGGVDRCSVSRGQGRVRSVGQGGCGISGREGSVREVRRWCDVGANRRQRNRPLLDQMGVRRVRAEPWRGVDERRRVDDTAGLVGVHRSRRGQHAAVRDGCEERTGFSYRRSEESAQHHQLEHLVVCVVRMGND